MALGSRADRSARLFARVLGARHLAEFLAIGRRRGRIWPLAGGSVDVLHAASMLALAAAMPERRRPALASAATATALAAGCFYEAASA